MIATSQTRTSRCGSLIRVTLHFISNASVRSGQYGSAFDHYLGTAVDDGIYWIWIGTHAEYDKIVDQPSA
jgi:hypothetical protein